jgi:hypothetical protein
MERSPFIMAMVLLQHSSVSCGPVTHNEMLAGLLDILASLRTELLDPGWSVYHRDVMNPGQDESPRIVAEHIARILQSTVSFNSAGLQGAMASGV